MTQPMLYMIAGPNGAGKTTAAMRLLPDFLSVHEFVNADSIAYGLNPLDAQGQEVAAGRVMLKRIHDLISAKKSFAFETTGASHFISILNEAKAAGYHLGLIYLWLPLVSFAKFRVKMRVAQGGHDIPDNVIERRYKRGLYNVWHHYLPLMDQASFFDNVLPSAYLRLIAEKRGSLMHIHRPDIWNAMKQMAEEIKNESAD
jgi:predicted ABC-type ATPase